MYIGRCECYMKNTDLIYKLWVQDELVPRSIHIDDDLYEELEEYGYG